MGIRRYRHQSPVHHLRQYGVDGAPGAGIVPGQSLFDPHILQDVQQCPAQGIPHRAGDHVELGVADMRGLVGQVTPGDLLVARVIGVGGRNHNTLAVGVGVRALYQDLDAELLAIGRRHNGQGLSQCLLHDTLPKNA